MNIINSDKLSSVVGGILWRPPLTKEIRIKERADFDKNYKSKEYRESNCKNKNYEQCFQDRLHIKYVLSR
ncbi:hypothetical protein [uncultured Shewanella sp.]|uniref:hypothetical protein n=1 Tax=uncultured Shewanella sp. TaxID=173975 RepID=UPI002608A2C2|nr:hypothetical protein [uncultured Shewanella sp.]